MGTNYSPRIVTDGLVLCLDAKDIKSYAGSGTTWTDRSGNDNDGSIDGATFNSNGYFELDGTNDKITTGAKLSNTENGSIYLWVKPATPPNTSGHMLFYQGTGVGRIWVYFYSDGAIGLNTYFGTGKDFYLTATGLDSVNKWGLVTITLNRSDKEKIYYNGELINSKDISSASSDSWGSSYLAIGGFDYDGPSWYTAEEEAAQFLVYNAEHSADQIRQNFNALRGRFGI
jgi:hypothetical protein|tara:strand:- start:42 stop:728 length:687 start_codon:yes stop_codon:yes gene_type:complete